MKKSDLECGNVVEVRNGRKYFVYHSCTGKALTSLITGWSVGFDAYNENLTYSNDFIDFDIMKVYKDYTCKELLWERKDEPKLTEDEKAILKVLLKEKYKWIARDKNGCLYVYASKPEKVITIWEGSGLPMMPFNHLFQFIKWEDDEPYSIEELLGKEK